MAEIQAEQEKVKATMDFKRQEFNKMWGKAPKDAQDSIAEDQVEWVKKRDEICVEEAKEAEPEYQEIVRMKCITRMLGDRYYEVKSYFDNW